MVYISIMDNQFLITPSFKKVAEKIILSIAHKMRNNSEHVEKVFLTSHLLGKKFIQYRFNKVYYIPHSFHPKIIAPTFISHHIVITQKRLVLTNQSPTKRWCLLSNLSQLRFECPVMVTPDLWNGIRNFLKIRSIHSWRFDHTTRAPFWTIDRNELSSAAFSEVLQGGHVVRESKKWSGRSGTGMLVRENF